MQGLLVLGFVIKSHKTLAIKSCYYYTEEMGVDMNRFEAHKDYINCKMLSMFFLFTVFRQKKFQL